MNRRGATLGIVAAMVSACARDTGDAKPAAQAPRKLPGVMVYKSEGCTCCELWVEHVRAAGVEMIRVHRVLFSRSLHAIAARLRPSRRQTAPRLGPHEDGCPHVPP
jgi:hypothetical protein